MKVALYVGLREQGSNLIKRFVHLEAYAIETLYVAASELAVYCGQFGNCVSHSAALDCSNVERGFIVEPALRQPGDDFGCYSNGGDTLFRLYSGVRGASRYLDVEAYILRTGRGYLAWRPLAVEYDGLLALDEREVQIARAHESYFLPRE